MQQADIRDALDQWWAFEAENEPSQNDPDLFKRVTEHIDSLPDVQWRLVLGRIIRELFVNEEAMKEGYGPEDARDFLNWLESKDLLI